MIESDKPNVVIVDYGVGNLFSVKHACNSVGMQASITSCKQEILLADAVILPGVGAFGNAIESLRKLDLINVLKDVATSSTPFVGICLGMHLLMDESEEFGSHQGLGIIKGSVIRFDNPVDVSGKHLKVPHVGWGRIHRNIDIRGNSWDSSVLEGLPDGEFMYFVHSFYVKPENSSLILSTTQYGNIEFCSSMQSKNIFACQFHPERSGLQGLKIYGKLASFINEQSKGN
jgi:imidazole glycerol phosphate synthase, glutamine amidotransferase subunit